METERCIYARKSVRKYSGRRLGREAVEQLLLAGLQAPSGKNGQPWRFLVVQEDRELLRRLSALTVYEPFVRTADALVAVILDKTRSYHYVKDCQAIGACIENMLLLAADRGIGACWIGEILNRETAVRELLGLSKSLDLMAVLALGAPNEEPDTVRMNKRSLSDCLLGWY